MNTGVIELIRKLSSVLTKKVVAEKLDVNLSTIYNLLNGKVKYPSEKFVNKLKEAFPVESTDIFYIHNMNERKIKRCSVPRCQKWEKTKGMCESHYREVLKHGKIREAVEKRAPKGQGHLDREGYVRVRNPLTGGATFKHRVVMEEKLGRLLLPHESVHHINGIRNDNRPENLELWSVSQPSGKRVDEKIAHAIKFLSEYGYVVTKE